jgi:hypothetical protein
MGATVPTGYRGRGQLEAPGGVASQDGSEVAFLAQRL